MSDIEGDRITGLVPIKAPFDFLVPVHETIVTEKGERVELFRLGTCQDGVHEALGFYPGKYEQHVHHRANSVFRISYGIGMIVLDGVVESYKVGDVFEVPAGMWHGFEVQTPTMLLATLDRPIKDPKTGEFDFHYRK